MLTATLRLATGYTHTLAHAVMHAGVLRDASVRSALARQVVVTGVQSLHYVCIVAALFGAVVVTRAIALLGPGDDTVLKTVVWGGLRELGPLLTALILIVRSGVAIAAEVALMRLRGAIHDSYWQDLDQEDEVVLPRVLGAALSAAALVSCFQFVAIAAALVASAITLGSSVEFEMEAFFTAARWQQVPMSIAKGALFGAGIASIACYHGLQAGADMSDVPKAVVAACVGALSFVLVVDLIAAVWAVL
jgi:phospholipid/cholesterol/gamma-HCH transport system permease protein